MKKTSLGDLFFFFFIMGISNGIKFQPRFTVSNMLDEKGVPTNMHKIKAHEVLG